MIGTFVNTVAVLAGSCLGMALKSGFPKRYQQILFQVIGLVTLGLGIGMVYQTEQWIVVILSVTIGGVLGTWGEFEERMERLGDRLKERFKIGSDRFTEGILTAFLLFCIGSMTFLGVIQEGTGQSSDLLFTKSVLDFISSAVLASVFGVAILWSGVLLFLFQGVLTLLANQLSLFITPEIMNGLTAVGGLMLLGLALNILEIKKIPMANMLPALVLVVFFTVLRGFFY